MNYYSYCSNLLFMIMIFLASLSGELVTELTFFSDPYLIVKCEVGGGWRIVDSSPPPQKYKIGAIVSHQFVNVLIFCY